MSKSNGNAFNDMKKSYNKAMKQERKRNGLPANKKPYYWEQNSIKSKQYKSKPEKGIDISKIPAGTYQYNESNAKSGCYIATCVYGSYDCPEVWTLRRFRDFTLDETMYGRLFIKCYYAISPKVVRIFGNKLWFKNFWRKHLDAWVAKLNQKGVASTEYHDKF